MVGRPHSLVPLVLAVLLVRARLAERSGAAGTDANAVATFIASVVPVFEYWDDPARQPRPLPKELRDGVFRQGGRELRFVDGRPSKHLLAVQADDIGCVVEMLQRPEAAARVRSRVLRAHAARLRRRLRELKARSAELLGDAEQHPPAARARRRSKR